MAKSKEYKNVKNFIHNEVKIDKDFILKNSHEYIDTKLDKYISDKLDSNWFESAIIRIVGDVVTGKKGYYNRYTPTDKNFVDYTKGRIDEIIEREVKKRMNFDKININIEKS